MALFQGTFRSRVMGREVHMSAALPEEDGPYRVLYLLHALGENDSAYLRYTEVERYAIEHNIAIIMPNADNSYYTDSVFGENYFTHIASEIPQAASRLFQISGKREDTFVAGFSMGGYGALKIGLSFPERFSKIASISAPADLTLSGQYGSPLFAKIFGPDNPIKGTEHDIKTLAERICRDQKPFPEIYMCCGLQDRLLEANRIVSGALREMGGFRLQYHEAAGGHTLDFRNEHLRNVILWLTGEEQDA